MLEAGPMKPISQFPTHRIRRWNLPGRGLKGDYFQEWLTQTGFLADRAKEPYSVAGTDHFAFWRVRAVGGKSLFWAEVTPRFGPEEFQPLDDYDAKLTLTNEKVAPFYDRVEELIGVSSTVQPVGAFPLNKGLTPFAPKAAEVEMTKACESLNRGLKVIPIPKGILTADHRGRPACHYCGPCWQGCDSGSKFDSLRVFVLAARNTGRLDLVPNARVRNLGLGADGKIKAVYYFDSEKRQWQELQGKSFGLCAGAIESSHILLNSKIANSSGLIGRYLSEHLYASVGGKLPQLMGRKIANEDGSVAHVFIPDLKKHWRGKKFIRGYQIFPTGGTGQFTLVGNQIPGYGKEWMEAVRAYSTAGVSILFQGEVLPNRNPKPNENGHSIHYLGSARMGNDPRTSVTNKWNQSHDVPNLFLNDAAPFVTAGNQNPTLTILALAMRSSERMVNLMKNNTWKD